MPTENSVQKNPILLWSSVWKYSGSQLIIFPDSVIPKLEFKFYKNLNTCVKAFIFQNKNWRGKKKRIIWEKSKKNCRVGYLKFGLGFQ